MMFDEPPPNFLMNMQGDLGLAIAQKNWELVENSYKALKGFLLEWAKEYYE